MSWKQGKSYSQDLRDRVLEARAGASIRAVAKRFGVSPSYVSKVASRDRKTGERTARAQRSHQTSALAPHREALAALLGSENDLTLAEICGWLELHHGVVVTPAWMSVSLRRFGLTRKKSRSTPASRSAPT